MVKLISIPNSFHNSYNLFAEQLLKSDARRRALLFLRFKLYEPAKPKYSSCFMLHQDFCELSNKKNDMKALQFSVIHLFAVGNNVPVK
jgi:hypothetical protein